MKRRKKYMLWSLLLAQLKAMVSKNGELSFFFSDKRKKVIHFKRDIFIYFYITSK